jgi:hypothetical protein
MFTITIDVKKKLKKYFDAIDARFADIVSTLNAILLRLDSISLKLITIEGKEDILMANVAQDFEALRVALDDATNAVATKIATLTSSIKNSMTDAEVANLKSGFGAVKDTLNALAASPSDPVPSDPITNP